VIIVQIRACYFMDAGQSLPNRKVMAAGAVRHMKRGHTGREY